MKRHFDANINIKKLKIYLNSYYPKIKGLWTDREALNTLHKMFINYKKETFEDIFELDPHLRFKNKKQQLKGLHTRQNTSAGTQSITLQVKKGHFDTEHKDLVFADLVFFHLVGRDWPFPERKKFR